MASRLLWMGYSHGGGRTKLDVGGPGSKVLLTGSRSKDMAALAVVSAKEAGTAPVVLDLDGSTSRYVSGYLDAYDYRSFLYDSFRLEEPEAWHAQLAAAAYTAALDLSGEEESILNAAMQAVASDGTLLSPVSLHDVIGKVEGFRGFYVDKLKGRIGALSLFDAVDDQSIVKLVEGNLVIDFHLAPYPQAAELAAGLFLAKFLTLAHSRGTGDGFLLITDAHRIFRGSPRPVQSNRLLSHLLDWQGAVVFSTGQPSSLSPLLLQSCPVQVFSSDSWHSQPRPVEPVLSGSFVLSDRRTERTESFVPRLVTAKSADYVRAASATYPARGLTARILEEVGRYPHTTPESLVQYFAPEFLPADVTAALASLEREGCLVLEPKDVGSGPRVFSYTVTDKGRRRLKELSG